MHHLVSGRYIRNYAVIALAIVILMLGIPLFVGGVWLMILTGAWYYILAGAGMCMTGYFLFQKSLNAVWVYLLTFIGTVYRTLSKTAVDWWTQMPWLVIPTVILLLLLLAIPVLTGAAHQKTQAPKLTI